MNIEIKPIRNYVEEPIFIRCEEIDFLVSCAVDKSGNCYPAQKCDGGVIVILTAKQGEKTELTLSNEKTFDNISSNTEDDKLNIIFDGKLFSSYQYSEKFKKPFFGPIYTKTGNTFTRPDLFHEEHPHQRSLFIGVGDVNGVDIWNEPEDSGYLLKGKPYNVTCGSAYLSFEADNTWVDKDANKLMDETRKITVYNQSDDCRYIDIEVTFQANYGEVKFGPTKEAGPLGIRVNEAINVEHGGYMKNSYGAVGEAECWSKSAQWCLYGGKLDNENVSIAVFDNEDNERYPTCWHIRNYGLFAANNLYFRGGLTIKENEKLSYKYRICFFNNDGKDVNDRFLIYNLNK